MDKFEIANLLREAGLLLNVSPENRYKARAYLKGARALESISEDISRVIEEGRLLEIPGIGKSLAASITEIYKTGEFKYLSKLRAELPVGIIELSRVPGLTVKRIEALTKALGISTLDQLEQACLTHQLQQVPGFGLKTEASILKGIESYRQQASKILLLHALGTADQIVQYVQPASPGSDPVIAGTIRRWHEVVDSIDLVAERRGDLLQRFANFPLVTQVIVHNENFCRVRLAEGQLASLTLTDCFPSGLLAATGSEDHFSKLCAIAEQRGLVLSAAGLYRDGEPLPIESERDIYAALGLHYVPPELREDSGEIEQAIFDDFADLIHINHIKGLTHCHTTYSDGTESIYKMAIEAQRMGMKYITITDHSPAAHYAGGVGADRLKRQWEEIERVQEQLDIRLLKGTECDILADGELDYPDHILEQFDIIIASVHSRFKLDRNDMTRRLIRCMQNKHFKVWGHPLGRLLLRRPPVDCDVTRILEVIAESRAAVEINGDPYRMDLEPAWLIEARKLGIKFVISTDAHSTGDYRSLRFGVHQARRACIRRSEVLNALNVEQFSQAVRSVSA